MAEGRTPGAGWLGGAAQRLLDLTVDLACVTDFDGTLLELSEGWTELLGYDCAELVGRPLVDLVHPDDATRISDQLRAGRTSQDLVRAEIRLVSRDGQSRPLSWTAIAVPAEERYYTVAHDLTSQRDAEGLLRDSERRYFDLIESAHDIVQSIAPDGHFDFVNKSWHDHLGYTPEELPGLTLFDIIAPAEHEHCTMLLHQIMNGESVEQLETTFVGKDGRPFPVEGNATGRFRHGTFVGTHTFFRDISERREAEALASQYRHRLEQDVAERTAALVQSEKLATLGRLTAGMAHELNNPAAAAQRGAVRLREAYAQSSAAFIDLAKLGLSDHDASQVAELVEHSAARAKEPDTLDPVARSDREAEVEEWVDAHGLDGAWDLAGPVVALGLGVEDLDELTRRVSQAQLPLVLGLMSQSHTAFALMEQIAHGTLRISQIVTALKEYSFMDRAPVQDVDVHEGLDNTLVMLQAKLKHGVEVAREYGDDLPRIEARGVELNQVWTNLIDNAVDAMDGVGHLVVRTSAVDDAVVVEVEDDGPGIASEHLDKVFDPFFTTKRPGQGTGLGLNTVFNILRRSGGHIDVRSAPGCTVFQVRLPVTWTGPEEADAAP